MSINLETEFRDADHNKIILKDIINHIEDEILSHPEIEYKLSIGTDSMTCKDTLFVLAIVLYRVGRGGIYYYKKINHSHISDLRTKLYDETKLSLDTADIFIDSILKEDNNLLDKINFSIHLDIGKNGPTKDLIRELEGWVTSMGYDYAIKPDSYAATTIANMHSK